MPLSLIALICVVVASVAVAVYVYLQERARRTIVDRVANWDTPTGFAVLPDSAAASLLTRVATFVPQRWRSNDKLESKLTQAGHDGSLAPLAYGAIRVALLIGVPLLVALVAPKNVFNDYVIYVAIAFVIAAIVPVWHLERAVRLRQERIAHSLPDALDLLVVCLEAGISLDAAILRVAKDLALVHPELSAELLIVNRKTNAGLPRTEALQGLWTRTGVGEVRVLITHIVQGEKWGTSSGKVLRTYAETLRRQRRQAAEKKAATAPVKMLVPLGLCIFPALLLVILGPVALNVIKLFK